MHEVYQLNLHIPIIFSGALIGVPHFQESVLMDFSRVLISILGLQVLLLLCSIQGVSAAQSNLFREYIGAEFKNVKFSDLPIHSDVDFHFILSFAIDYDTSSSPSPTDGNFNVFWDTDNLSPDDVQAIKNQHPNVKVALSLGGDSIGDNDQKVYFHPSSVDSWVSKAVSSLTKIIRQYNLDGIDIDYEHFRASPEIFSQCIGKLISTLKQNGVISFASIAPYDNDEVQSHYQALWKTHGQIIDFVNFQFYAYDADTTVDQFMGYFATQRNNYDGGKILASFSTGGDGGLSPDNGFFTACSRLKSQGQLGGIFVWSADDSKAQGFRYEKQSQALLAIPH